MRLKMMEDLLEQRGAVHSNLASLTVAEVAALMDISESGVRRLVARGDLPSYRAGRRARRVRIEDLTRYIDSQRSA